MDRSRPTPIVASGILGWGNRKAGLEAYGPGGRWAGPEDLPDRPAENVAYGDLLGDYLGERGAFEGAQLIVIAFNRFTPVESVDALRAEIGTLLEHWS